eukprot:2459651-Amphidinium_carterae.2
MYSCALETYSHCWHTYKVVHLVSRVEQRGTAGALMSLIEPTGPRAAHVSSVHVWQDYLYKCDKDLVCMVQCKMLAAKLLHDQAEQVKELAETVACLSCPNLLHRGQKSEQREITHTPRKTAQIHLENSSEIKCEVNVH